jgi:glycosyltransferase involved in cell wall biosynthesis
MKILYDHQVFEGQNFGGISRYFAELIKHNPTAELSLKYSDNIYVREQYFDKFGIFPQHYEYDKFLPRLHFKGKGTLCRYYNKVIGRNNHAITVKYLKESQFDLIHPTYYDPYFLNYLRGKQFVLTVHDMIHELLFPKDFPDYRTMVSNKKRLILQAHSIIAVSENTKKDIVRLFPDLAGKINVVYHGFSFPQLDNNEKENYILYTGTRYFYKNFNNFLQAVAPLLIKYNLRLFCAGSPFDNYEKNLLDSLNISDRTTICKCISDAELSELYSKALAFVFPSLYEGFGIPVLEAFASQCPAVLSNTSSLPEIGGDAAVYFDPYSIDDMRIQIERIICSTALQKELVNKGKERLKLFSWAQCAQETMEVYNSIA